MSTAAKTPNYNLSQVVGSDIPDWITDYTSDMGKIDAALKENADIVRPDEFSEESTYVAGDYCIKNNVIYKAKTAVAAGAFDVSDWEATSIFKELSALTNKILRVDYGTHSVGAITAGQTYRETIKYNFEFKNAPIPSFAYNSRELSTCHTVPYVREMHASYFIIEFIPDVTSDVCNISWFAVGE